MMTTGAMEQTGETMLIEENAKMKDLLKLILVKGREQSTEAVDPWEQHKIEERIKEILGTSL